jgi:PelA/Pel-15E family pectate lyase
MRFVRLVVPILFCAQLHAAVIGVSQPADSITVKRIAALPAKERAAWMAYLKRSEEQMRVDRATLAAELKPGETALAQPKEGRSAMSLKKESAWYGGAEARHIADVIVSFQTPGGGWSKNMSMDGELRLRGQPYAADNVSKFLGVDDFDRPRDPHWNYVSTLDNDATNTELRFLVLVSGQTPGAAGDVYRASFLKGIRYLLAAQFPNGGWPQVWPLEGGYHDAITFNDNAVSETATTLTNVSEGKGDYAFVPAALRKQAGESAARALKCILATQIVIDGKKTVWAQQHDALTLVPVAGRNFEPAALSASESGDLLEYLMSLPHPSKELIASINAAAVWLKGAAIYGFEYAGGRGTEGGRQLRPKEGAGPLWARYYSMTTGKPVFGDRDKTIHDGVNELSLERRNGYAWYSGGEKKVLDEYAVWSKAHGVGGAGE